MDWKSRHSMRNLLALSLLSALLAAGCIQPAPTRTTAEPDPTPCGLGACPTGSLGDWDNLTMSDCSGYQHNFSQPKSGVFQAEYPSSMRSNGGVSDTATLQIWHCKQAIIGDAVVDGLEFAYFSALISNPDKTQPKDAHLLLLTTYSNNAVFIEKCKQYGLNVTLAPDLEAVSRTPLANDVDLTSYVYPSDSKDFVFRGDVDHKNAAALTLELGMYYSVGDKVHRILYSEKGKVDSFNSGVMEFGPQSYWAKHSKANYIDDLVNYNTQAAITFDFDLAWRMNTTASR